MKKIIWVLICILVLLSFTYAVTTWTPPGNADFRNTYNITNVPEYNGTNIDISGNITVNENSYICLLSNCSKYITYNGTTLIING